MDGVVFISHSSKDQKPAQAVCAALEGRGIRCWISLRDIGPGENYQEAIVGAIARASVMVLVFTANANTSDEIKKELALASAHQLPIIPVRTEDIAPTGAFQYELATRQWIDVFTGWDEAMRRLADRIAHIGSEPGAAPGAVTAPAAPPRLPVWRRPAVVAAGAAALAVVAAAGLYVPRLLEPAGQRAAVPGSHVTRAKPDLVAVAGDLMAKGRYESAISQYRAAIAADSGNIAARRGLITALSREYTLRAFPVGDEAIDIALRSDYARYAYVDDADIDAALGAIADLRSMDPLSRRDATLLLDEALILKTNGARAHEAIPVLQQALEAEPQSPHVLAELGLLQAVLAPDGPAARDRALGKIRTAIQLKPDVARYRLYLGRALDVTYLCSYAGLDYAGGGDAEACAEAIRAFRQAAELATAHDGWLRHRAQVSAMEIFHRYARKEDDILTPKLAMPAQERLQQLRFFVPAEASLAQNGPDDDPRFWEAELLFATGHAADADQALRKLLRAGFATFPSQEPARYWQNAAYVQSRPHYFALLARILESEKVDAPMQAGIAGLLKQTRSVQ